MTGRNDIAENLVWQIGEVKITCIVETMLPVEYHEKYPFLREATPTALKAILSLASC